MEVLIGITGVDFVVSLADATSARSIVVMKQGEDKTRALGKNVLMSFTGNKPYMLLIQGEAGDTVQFAEYVQSNVKLYGIKNDVPLSVKASATFVRKEMATSLRSRNPYHVNLLVSGTDAKTGTPELYWIDHYSAMQKMNFAAHGYASYFCMSIMDRYWHANLSVEEAIALLRKCVNELRVRFTGNFPQFFVKIVDKTGIRMLDIANL